jgi:hypothetical protein
MRTVSTLYPKPGRFGRSNGAGKSPPANKWLYLNGYSSGTVGPGELFRAAVLQALGNQLAAASAVPANTKKLLESSLVAALDEWARASCGSDWGRCLGPDIETSGLLAGSIKSDHERRFEQTLADALRGLALADGRISTLWYFISATCTNSSCGRPRFQRSF